MKYTARILLSLLALFTTLAAGAQNTPTKIINPDITYSASHPRYELGGLAIEGAKNFDPELLASISGLTVGEVYEVPGTQIAEAVRRYWAQKLFSNVEITADSIVGNKIYLRVKLTPQPRISSINYSGVKKSEREDCEKIAGLQVGNQINTDVANRAKHFIKKRIL